MSIFPRETFATNSTEEKVRLRTVGDSECWIVPLHYPCEYSDGNLLNTINSRPDPGHRFDCHQGHSFRVQGFSRSQHLRISLDTPEVCGFDLVWHSDCSIPY